MVYVDGCLTVSKTVIAQVESFDVPAVFRCIDLKPDLFILHNVLILIAYTSRIQNLFILYMSRIYLLGSISEYKQAFKNCIKTIAIFTIPVNMAQFR